MLKKSEKRYAPPEAYTFLLAAGEIDRRCARRERVNVSRCAQELSRISCLNGSYALLPKEFRGNMQAVYGTRCDTLTALAMGRLGAKLADLDNLSEEERSEVRAKCSDLSRYWPATPSQSQRLCV